MPRASRSNGTGNGNGDDVERSQNGGETSDYNYYTYDNNDDDNNNNKNDNDTDDDYHFDSNDDDDDDDDYDDDCDDESYESEEDDGSNRTLLFLCEEGQLDLALKRVKQWDELCPNIDATNAKQPTEQQKQQQHQQQHQQHETLRATVRRELVRKNPSTGNCCLHEILAGGTSGRSAPDLAERLVRWTRALGLREIFEARPRGSHGRTLLHWCAWGGAPLDLSVSVVRGGPRALVLRDAPSHGSRTPAELSERYRPGGPLAVFLASATRSYLAHRVRECVKLCVRRYFCVCVAGGEKAAAVAEAAVAAAVMGGAAPSTTGTARNIIAVAVAAAADDDDDDNDDDNHDNTATAARTLASRTVPAATTATPRPLTPFDKADRRIAQLTPRAWFVASVLGYAIQRELQDLESRILSFVGGGAKLAPHERPPSGARKRKRKRKPRATTGSASRTTTTKTKTTKTTSESKPRTATHSSAETSPAVSQRITRSRARSDDGKADRHTSNAARTRRSK